MARSATSDNPAWLMELSTILRRDVDAAVNGVIRIDISRLTALWVCSQDEAEPILFEAAIRAGLAVGVVSGRFYDVMTFENAQAVLGKLESKTVKGLLNRNPGAALAKTGRIQSTGMSEAACGCGEGGKRKIATPPQRKTAPKPKTRPASKGRVRKRKSRM